MEIKEQVNGEEMILSLIGKLNTSTASLLEEELSKVPEEIQKLYVDLAEVDYVSSAGIRVVIAAHSMMKERGGSMIMRNLCEDVYDVFDMTGLTDVLEIEE